VERESGKAQLKPMAGGEPIPVSLTEVAQVVRGEPRG
jgi:histidyl-tRNA synthetase